MISNLQTLRILFSLLVATAHLNQVWEVLGVLPIADALAHVSVDGFIVVSAFLIPYTNALRPKPPLEFLGRRLARLAPFYWFVTYIVAALALLAPSLFQHTEVTTETLLKSLFFIPYEKQPGVPEPIVFVGWTMNLFVFYMVLHALSLKLFKERAWLATTLALLALVLAGVFFKPQNVVLQFFTMPRLLSFVAGTLLAHWWISTRDSIVPARMPRWAAPAIITLAAVCLVLITLRDYVFAGISPRVVGPILGAIFIASAIVLEKLGVSFKSRIRDTIAESCFAIYLTHFFVTQATVKTVLGLHLTSPWIIAPLLVVTYAAIVVLAVLAHKLVEVPLERMTRNLFQSLSRTSLSQAR